MRRKPEIIGLSETHAAEVEPRDHAPEEQNDFQKPTERLEQFVERETADMAREMEVQFSKREHDYQAIIKTAEIADLPNFKKLEKQFTSLRQTFKSLQNHFKRLVPLLLPLMIAAQDNRDHPIEQQAASFENRDVAAQQLAKNGITEERKSAYTPLVSEALYRGIIPLRPDDYSSVWSIIKLLPENLVLGREETIIEKDGESTTLRKSELQEREDAWRFYLGLAQEHHTFGISAYRPRQSKEDRYYYNINGWLEKFSQNLPGHDQPGFSSIKTILEGFEQKNHRTSEERTRIASELEDQKNKEAEISTRISSINESRKIHKLIYDELKREHPVPDEKIPLEQWPNELLRIYETKWWAYKDELHSLTSKRREIRKEIEQRETALRLPNWITGVGNDFVIAHDIRRMADGSGREGATGQVKISLGHDVRGSYLSYYDIWDDLEGAGKEHLFGKPFEIYDRIYYDAETFNVIP